MVHQAWSTSSTDGHPSQRVYRPPKCFLQIACSRINSPCLVPSFTITSRLPCFIAIQSSQVRHYIIARMGVSLKPPFQVVFNQGRRESCQECLSIRGLRANCKSMISLNRSPTFTIKTTMATKVHRGRPVENKEEWSLLISHRWKQLNSMEKKVWQAPPLWILFLLRINSFTTSTSAKVRQTSIHILIFSK